MGSFKVEGGHKLSGKITPQGAKNEALQVICASLLTKEEVVISNIPDILDVNTLINILDFLGVKVNKVNADTYRFKADNVDPDILLDEEFSKRSRKLRGSIMLIGPMLARFHKAFI